jgi:hypothetical protein
MAVRDSMRRLEKWDAKYTGQAMPPVMGPYKSKMLAQLSTIFGQLETLENEVKTILGEIATVQTIQNPFYHAYAKELYRLSKKFSGSAYTNEAALVTFKWTARGLNPPALTRIAALFP